MIYFPSININEMVKFKINVITKKLHLVEQATFLCRISIKRTCQRGFNLPPPAILPIKRTTSEGQAFEIKAVKKNLENFDNYTAFDFHKS